MILHYMPRRAESRLNTAARGCALFLGLYSLIGVVVSCFSRHLDPNLLWIDLRVFSERAANTYLTLLSLALLAFAVVPQRAGRWRFVMAGVVGCGAVAAAENAVSFWLLAARHQIQVGLWVPISLIIVCVLTGIAWSILANRDGASRPWSIVGIAVACAIVFPVLQVFGFGKTNYQRQADVAVVFGARVYADGSLSDAVRDRVATAVELHKRGVVTHLLMSGGPGNGTIHETAAMKDAAVRMGVPASAILVDKEGLNTAATVLNSERVARAENWRRLVAVSEFYHLPRIKMAFAAVGREVFTVPAQPRHWARAWAPANVAREIPAFWVYWLRSTAHQA